MFNCSAFYRALARALLLLLLLLYRSVGPCVTDYESRNRGQPRNLAATMACTLCHALSRAPAVSCSGLSGPCAP
jgi:hypothetical protein